jgi:hypothetical protein
LCIGCECLTNDGDIVLRGLELPESNVNGDTTLALSLEFVEHPCVLEGTLAEFGGFLRGVSIVLKGEMRRASWCWGCQVRIRTSVTRKVRTTPPSKMPLVAAPKSAERSEAAPDAGGAPTERNVCLYLLELLDGTLVDTSALVDQVCVL